MFKKIIVSAFVCLGVIPPSAYPAGTFGGLVVPNLGQVKNGDWLKRSAAETCLSPLFEKRGLTAKTGTVSGDVGRAAWTVPAFVAAADVPVPALKNGDWLKRSEAETCLSPLFTGGDDVRYYMDAPWGRLYVTEQGLLLSIIVPEEQAGGIEAAPTSSGRGGGGGRRPDGNFDHPAPQVIRQTGILLDLPGACWREVIPEDPQVTKLNFFYGNDPKGWVTDVPTYGRLRISNVLPGTDLVLEPKSVEFWCMEGIQAPMLRDLEAQIMERTGAGKPIKPEGFAHRALSGRADFPIPATSMAPHAADATQYPDQALLWGTFLGGRDYEAIAALAVDADDAVIAAGYAYSRDFPVADGYDITPNGVRDLFIVKLSPAGGTLLWGTFLGGTKDEVAVAMALDPQRNIVVMGITISEDIPTTPDAFDTTYNGGPYPYPYVVDGDIYVAKLSAQGNTLLWGTYIGGWNDDEVRGGTLDASGNVILVGSTDSDDIPVPGGFDTQWNGGNDIYLAQLSGDGRNLLWATYLGGSKNDGAYTPELDPVGNIVILGSTSSPDIPVPNGYDTVLDGEFAAGYVAKISIRDNAILWATYIEGTQGLLTFSGIVNGAALGPAGDVYLIGTTDVEDMPVPGGFDTTFAGGHDIYLAKLSSDGAHLLWGSYLGGASDDYGSRILFNREGDLLVLGHTFSADMPVPNGYSTTSGEQIYLAKITLAENRLKWGTYLGGWESDRSSSLVLDSAGNIIIGGATYSPDFPVPNGYDQTHHGFDDAFVAKITDFFGAGQRLFVPAAAHTPGAYGTSWRTDGMILNPGAGEVCYDLWYHTTKSADEEDLLCERRCLAPDAAWVYTDIVGAVCGKPEASAGNLRVEPTGPLKMSTRTYTEREDGGTYGQFVPALTRGEGIGVGETGHLIVLKQNDDYRTNLGFSEITGQKADISVTIYDSSGSTLFASTFSLQPYAWRQIGLAEMGLSNLDLGRAEIKVTSGGAAHSYASIVDNLTGDAVYMPAQKASGGTASRAQLIAAVAHTPGGYGTHWQSDLWLYNTWDTTEANLILYYYTVSGRFSTTITLAPHEQLEIQDIVAQLYPAAGEGAGNLMIYDAWQVLTVSRTYNIFSDGTYGQFIPAKAEGQVLSGGIEGRLLQLKCGTAYRTNVGLSKFWGNETTLLVEIYDINGTVLGSQTYTVQSHQNLQINDIFLALGAQCFEAGAYARLVILSGSEAYVYASVVDNKSGDAIFIPMSK